MTDQIEAIYLEEPRRDGEYPDGAHVGYGGITSIVRREDNYGDHGLLWFDVFKGDVLFKSYGGRHVAVIFYAAPQKDDK